MDRFQILRSPKFLAIFGLLGWVYWPTIAQLYDTWTTHPDYSHGLLVPFFAIYLLLQSRKPIAAVARPWPVIGFATLGLAISLRLFGAATSFLPIEGASLVMCLTALAMIAGGKFALKRFWMSLTFLLFMVPLPYEMSRLMGAELQRVATACSTFVLQCLGQPAIAEGNRILIEGVTLNVVEACSGLRMLVTFLAFSVAAAMLLERHWSVKGIVLGSAVPIAILTNVLRITVTGLGHVLLTPGESKVKIMEFIHDFNGWMMMPIGLSFLLFELWVLKHLLIERSGVRRSRPSAGPATTAAPLIVKKPRFASVIQVPVSR